MIDVRFLEGRQGGVDVAHAHGVQGERVLERHYPGTHPGVRHRDVPRTGERPELPARLGTDDPVAGQDQRSFCLAQRHRDPVERAEESCLARTIGQTGIGVSVQSCFMTSSGSSSMTGPGLSRRAVSNAFRTSIGTVDGLAR